MSLRTVKLAIVFVMVAGVSVALAHSAGPSPGYTGAPGEFNCRQCHSTFALNDSLGTLAIEGVPATYEPGRTYTITVRIDRPDRARWGFQMTALTGALEPAGTFRLTEPTRTQLKTDDGRTYVEHRTAGTNAGSTGGNSWIVEWTAPAAGTGVVDFYAAGNAANNNNAQTGDNIYTTFAEAAEAVAAAPFVEVTAAAGLSRAPGAAGVAWADFDADGDDDFALVGGAVRLYRNEGGGFADVTASVGLGADAGARGAAWGDFDGDARPDLAVATGAGVRLYRNTASGLVDATATSGVPDLGPASVVAWIDYDADGRLDLFAGFDADAALLRNTGAAFVDATAAAGLAGISGVRVAAWADYDGDGRTDVFAATASRALLYRQVVGASFEDATAPAGLSGAAGARDAVWADYDGDGRLDLFVATGEAARLYRGTSDGTFDDATSGVGLSGVAADALAIDDSDGDGRVDLLAAEAGGVRLMRYSGAAFVDATAAAGIGGVDGIAATWADADGDGHADLFTVSASGVGLWRNPSAAATLSVRAVAKGGADAPGSRIAFDSAQVRVVSGGGSAAQPPARALFATATPRTAATTAIFPGGVGREATATTGDAVALALDEPDAAARVTGVSYKLKSGTDKLLVDGERLATGVEVVEVDGVRMDETKYPKKKRNGDGTSARIVGTDASFGALVPRGHRVFVTTFDPATGVRSAPFAFTRP
jgi:hypothetical protein